jgi:regulation of enolase protein 1 (concanavalin A-like superfamily)
MSVQTSLAMLHRKGPRNTDQYGCDLAVTVRVEPGAFRKTALFQFKRSADFSVVVNRTQLDDALSDARIGPRAYVLALEEVRQALRIESISVLDSRFNSRNETTFDALTWSSVAEWLHGWLRCDIGPSSLEPDDDGVEELLTEFVVEPPEITLFDDVERVAPEGIDFIPARAWLQILIAPAELL